MGVYHNLSFFHRFLLAVGWAFSVAGGIWINQHYHEEPLAAFHSQATDIFKELNDPSLTYAAMLDAPYDTFRTSGIIAKDGQQRYLDSLPRRPYPGLEGGIRWLDIEALSGPNFCKRWSAIETSGHPTLLSHLPVRMVDMTQNVPHRDCAGALEARFDVETLFSHLLKSAIDKGMGVRISTGSSPYGINHDAGQIFAKGRQEEAGDVWKEEAYFMFYTVRLHVVLSAPTQGWPLEWAGVRSLPSQDLCLAESST